VLRSWSVGVGELGALHTDPAVYNAVLGDIASPALVISTKFTQGDYFAHLPLNPTLRTRSAEATDRVPGEARVRRVRRDSQLSWAVTTQSRCVRCCP